MENVVEVCKQHLKNCEKKRNLSVHTIKAYNTDLKQLITYLGKETLLINIGKSHLVGFHSHLIEFNLAQASIKRKMACIRAMFKWLEEEEVIDFNPFNKIKIEIKIPKRLPKNVPKSDMRLMLHQAGETLNTKKVEADSPYIYFENNVTSKKEINVLTTLLSVELLICTGVRVCELCSIKVGDIFLNGVLGIFPSKKT